MPAHKQKTYSIDQAAEILGISKDTLRRWEKKGKIASYRTKGGHRRYTAKQIEGIHILKNGFNGSTSIHIPESAPPKSKVLKPTPKVVTQSTQPVSSPTPNNTINTKQPLSHIYKVPEQTSPPQPEQFQW